MIYFRKIKWRNFLSYGNYDTELDFTQEKMNLVVGTNGVGKSTFLDALTFCLYGKPYRKINKPNLVNSINQRGLLTEVEFTVTENKRSTKYRIVRGIKPNIFQIYVKDKLLDETDKSRDQQKYLEENILRVNYRSFVQIVVLGTANYIPFMKLTPVHRREFIENLLDIGVFSNMNIILRERLAKIRTLEEQNTNEIRSLKDKIRIQEEFVSKLNSVSESVNEEIREIEKRLSKHRQMIVDNHELRDSLIINTISQEKYEDAAKSLVEKQGFISSQKSTISHHEKTIRFFDQNDVCPTCSQSLNEDHVRKITSENLKEIEQLNGQMQILIDEKTELERMIKEYTEVMSQVHDLNKEEYRLTELIKNDEELVNQKRKIQQSEHSVESKEQKDKLQRMQKRLKELEQRTTIITQKSKTYNIIHELLKDTGIKSRIISQYVPVINKLINQYLTEMNFHVNFNIDENFDEKILSRYRDEFTYDNFSQGEKLRIDIALLMVWRIIAEMKSSLNTNLLIMDEIFDSSLDADGLEDFLKILKTVSQSNNIFIISHKVDQLETKFDRTIKVKKQNDYSYMEVL